LTPAITLLSTDLNRLKFHIESNISSAGLNINKVRKIRFEEGKVNGESITLKYIVEIQKIAGKKVLLYEDIIMNKR